MDTWAARVRADPHSLASAPASALREVLEEVEEAFLRRPFPLLVEIPSDRPIVVVGDSHGDWPALSSALGFARDRHPPARFVGLGDYIHRATRSQPDPATLPGGSIWNATYVLAWAAQAPDEVVPLRGNHEATRQIPVPGPTLLREVRRTYGREATVDLWGRLIRLLEQLPLAARTAHGVFLSHGGIPPRDRWDPTDWRADDLRLLEGLLWSDPELEYEERFVGRPYGPEELGAFLSSIGCKVMVKGHAPDHSGRAIYGGRLLTVHTSDLFAGFGEKGVLLAEIPPGGQIGSAEEIRLREWDGRTWTARPTRFDRADPSPPPVPPATVFSSSYPAER